jgi:hypothetical protein
MKTPSKSAARPRRRTTASDATDGQIDKLVYELYELTPDEIKIVEGTTT